MIALLSKRLAFGVLTLLVGTFLVYVLCHASGSSAAVAALGEFATEQQRTLWLAQNGYNQPIILRYGTWLGRLLTGDFGVSRIYNAPAASVLGPRLLNSGYLLAGYLLLATPFAIVSGMIAGMNRGRLADRAISFAAIVLTSTPPYAMAVLVSLVFVFRLGWLPGTSSMMDGLALKELVLPVMVLVLFDGGYLSRIVRASTAQVMEQQYVRTARLKALPRRHIFWRHILRNALIAPITVILIHMNWVLTGVVVVEYFFAFKGFGSLILEASLSRDIDLLAACTIVTICVAVLTQVLADLSYAALDPRIRFA